MLSTLRKACRALASAIALAVAVGACDTGTPAVPELTFSEVYEAIISRRCLPCHSTGFGAVQGLLDMSTEMSAYFNLVGVKARGASCAPSGLTRIVPGNAQASLVFDKVNSKLMILAASCGDTMPDDVTTLSPADVDMIQRWIDDGASP